MKSNTREKLIESSLQRFYRDGFRNVGLDQILSDVGISKTAFYKHFECKEDLMLAVLEGHNDWFQDAFLKMIRDRGGGTPLGRLRAVWDVVDWVINEDDFQGCIFVNAAMEFPLPHDPAHQAAAKNKRELETIIRDLAADAGADDPAALAREFSLLIEGTYITRHITGNKSAIVDARRVAELLIARRCGAAPRQSADRSAGGR